MNYSVNLPSGKVVEYRRMRLSDENIILDRELAKKDSNIHTFLGSVCDMSLSEVKSLYVGDSTYLLIDIRVKNKGKEFDPQIQCPFCGRSSRVMIDLEDFLERNTVVLDREGLDDKDQFIIELPLSKYKLTMKLMTEGDGFDARREIRKFPGKSLSYTMLFRTVSIVDENGEKVIKTSKFFDELDIEDSDYLKLEYDRYDFGVETEIDCLCPLCNMSFRYELPINKDFFLRKSPVQKS